MEHEGSLPHSQKLNICSYPEPKQPSPCFPIQFLENTLPYLHQGLPTSLLPSGVHRLIMTTHKTITAVPYYTCQARLVTMDEYWFYHYDSETKQQSME